MSTDRVDRLLHQAEALTPDERLRLAAQLVERARQPPAVAPRRWRDLRGLAQPALGGEDAQAYIARMRREADEQRASLLRRES